MPEGGTSKWRPSIFSRFFPLIVIKEYPHDIAVEAMIKTPEIP
jgi:hypothetical protein